jgi:hypothetical protein
MSWGREANRMATTGHRIASLSCPTDLPTALPGGITRHNYGVNFGTTGLISAGLRYNPAENLSGVTWRGAPFQQGIARSLDWISDGSSSTLLAGEFIAGQRGDARGITWYGQTAGFWTFLRPNDSAPDRGHWSLPNSAADPAPPTLRSPVRSRRPRSPPAAGTWAASPWGCATAACSSSAI